MNYLKEYNLLFWFGAILVLMLVVGLGVYAVERSLAGITEAILVAVMILGSCPLIFMITKNVKSKMLISIPFTTLCIWAGYKLGSIAGLIAGEGIMTMKWYEIVLGAMAGVFPIILLYLWAFLPKDYLRIK